MTTETRTQAETEADPAARPLYKLIADAMERLAVPGVAVGLLHEGREHVAGFGVTNVDHPSPVVAGTLFQIGSTTKTVTATTVMRLVEDGKLDLDTPIRAYLPDLRLADEAVAADVTMRHLLTHTGGWTGDYFADMGRGEDALAKIVASMAELPQLTPLGEVWSYNNAGFYIAGRVIEAVTGQPYETVARELVLDPLGLAHTYFFPEEVMVHSFAAGHNVVDGTPKVATPWALARTANPAGGLTSSAGDQLRYAHFHMGDGTADGTRVLSRESLALMQTPAVPAGGDESVGLSWFVRNLDGVRLVRHGGGTNGQISEFLFAPERGFALTILTNANRGGELGEEVTKWALRHYLGVDEQEPAPLERTDDEIAAYAGRYAAALILVNLTPRNGELIVEMAFSDGFPADEPPPVPPPARAALYAEDKILMLDGPYKGARGEFLRGPGGEIAWLRFGGRVHKREA